MTNPSTKGFCYMPYPFGQATIGTWPAQSSQDAGPSFSPSFAPLPSNDAAPDVVCMLEELKAQATSTMRCLEESEVTIELQSDRTHILASDCARLTSNRNRALAEKEDVLANLVKLAEEIKTAAPTIVRQNETITQLTKDFNQAQQEKSCLAKHSLKWCRPTVDSIVTQVLQGLTSTASTSPKLLPHNARIFLDLEIKPTVRRSKIPHWKIIGLNHIGGDSSTKYVPVDLAIAWAYEEFEGPSPEGAIKHQFFFSQGQSNSCWNQEVVLNLVTQVVNQQATFRIPGDCIPSKVIKICLQDHLKQTHASWQLDKPCVHASGECYETAQEFHNCVHSQENA
ncbi:hypothetical protein BT96DRAFT_991116 [Gymnopus androsaceus JB14]|uniref:Uncharacterized protein n=1 Tax=Gymnopus androsaceus JB14 TaxID=1447944 RepID=A0A6A4HXL5_9AGAR|nr:hypothetical protein BT96DRAFT_991116 [Gymnopus androsaceus JB14]